MKRSSFGQGPIPSQAVHFSRPKRFLLNRAGRRSASARAAKGRRRIPSRSPSLFGDCQERSASLVGFFLGRSAPVIRTEALLQTEALPYLKTAQSEALPPGASRAEALPIKKALRGKRFSGWGLESGPDLRPRPSGGENLPIGWDGRRGKSTQRPDRPEGKETHPVEPARTAEQQH